MSKEIIKYKQVFKVTFNDPKIDPKFINSDEYPKIKNRMLERTPMEIGGEVFNWTEIKTITRYRMQDDILTLLQSEDEEIQNRVKKYISVYQKEITPGVLQNMIDKAKRNK